ncbi:hypothetical protein DUI87_25266 [Hirundo rustica rustica]|uniref:Uncharacterized protein n=1 Tax=Hirundo rustica rustica TaxID=333673 RepID=A0A3M0JDG1_HIRRU|nr:hypothetical protein DUI87_25266 [Hirundo rustica rustica]
MLFILFTDIGSRCKKTKSSQKPLQGPEAHCKLGKSYSVHQQVHKAFVVKGFTGLQRITGETEAYPNARKKANEIIHLPFALRLKRCWKKKKKKEEKEKKKEKEKEKKKKKKEKEKKKDDDDQTKHKVVL